MARAQNWKLIRDKNGSKLGLNHIKFCKLGLKRFNFFLTTTRTPWSRKEISYFYSMKDMLARVWSMDWRNVRSWIRRTSVFILWQVSHLMRNVDDLIKGSRKDRKKWIKSLIYYFWISKDNFLFSIMSKCLNLCYKVLEEE